MKYVCRICNLEISEIPKDAIPVGRQRYGHLTYLYPTEVVVHDFKVIKEEIPEVHEEK